jgi:hypothetical protein
LRQNNPISLLLGHTNARRSRIETVLHQLLHDGAQINDDLPRLDLMDLQMVNNKYYSFDASLTYRPALYGLDGGHGMVAFKERGHGRDDLKWFCTLDP